MIPDSIEPVVGYRAFDLHKSGWLESIGKGETIWEPGPNEACCLADIKAKWVRKNVDGELRRVKVLWHGLIPEPKCDCGFWLLNSQQAVIDHFYGPRRMDSMFTMMMTTWGGRSSDPTLRVVAEVKGWGRVIQAENGWRTEYAAVSALLEGSTEEATGKLAPNPLIHALAERYAVPVVKPEYEWPKPHKESEEIRSPVVEFKMWDDLSFVARPPSVFTDAGGIVVTDPATIGKVTGG